MSYTGMISVDSLILYVIYLLMIFYILHMTLKKQSPSAAKLREPVFKFIAFMLLYFVAEVDLIMGILLLCIIVLEEKENVT